MEYTPGDLLKRKLKGYEHIIYMVVRVVGEGWYYADGNRVVGVALIHWNGAPTLCTATWTKKQELDKEFEHTGINIARALNELDWSKVDGRV